MKELFRNKKAITLIALVITIIVLLILAGVTVATLSNSGLFEKTQEAKEKWENAKETEETGIGKMANGIDLLSTRVLEEDSNSEIGRTYNETVLFDQPKTSGTITFKDNHTIDEFDSIEFLYAVASGESYCGYQTAELRTRYWNYIMNNHANTTWVVGLYGYGTRTIDINNLSKTGFTIAYSVDHTLISVVGINY